MLEAIISYYNGGPVGLETLAATVGEEAITLEDMYEPYLKQIGRCATFRAYEHLGLQPPVTNAQAILEQMKIDDNTDD